jgi:hypothetical protein
MLEAGGSRRPPSKNRTAAVVDGTGDRDPVPV